MSTQAKDETLVPEALVARMAVEAPATAVNEFMFMPGGEKTISCGYGHPGAGKSKTVEATVVIDRKSADEVQRQLTAMRTNHTHKPYFDFNHEDAEASFWPSGFVWRDSPKPGIYVQGEWSEAGRAAIVGKSYQTFSPVFHVDDPKAKPARIVCQPRARLNMGGLVNDPAFDDNLPFWAKRTGAASAATNNTTVPVKPGLMIIPNERIMLKPDEAAALQAKIQTTEQELTELRAKEQSPEVVELIGPKEMQLKLDQAEMRAHLAESEATIAKQALVAQRGREADAEIAKHVARGAIPPARTTEATALHARYRSQYIEDPDATRAALIAMRGSAALTPAAVMPVASPRLSVQYAAVSRADNANMIAGLDAVLAKRGPNQTRVQQLEVAREFAALYAKEILPRHKEGDEIPLFASNSLGALAATVVSVRTLELLTLSLPILSRVATDFSDQIVSFGDTLKTRIVGIPTVVAYNQSTGWSNADKVDVDVSITYDQYKGTQLAIDAQSIAGTVRRLFDETAPAQAYALGKDMVDHLYTRITAANFITGVVDKLGNAVAATQAGLGTWGRSTLIDMAGHLDDQGQPDGGRFCILARPYWSAMKKDPAIITLAAYARPAIIEEGTLMDVEGFTLIKGVNLPATAITGAGVLKGFAGGRSSLVVAARLSANYMNVIPGAGNGLMSVVSTPSGFSANQVQFVDNKLGQTFQRLEIMFGDNVGQGAAGTILTDV